MLIVHDQENLRLGNAKPPADPGYNMFSSLDTPRFTSSYYIK